MAYWQMVYLFQMALKGDFQMLRGCLPAGKRRYECPWPGQLGCDVSGKVVMNEIQIGFSVYNHVSSCHLHFTFIYSIQIGS